MWAYLNKVTNINYIFRNCSSIIKLPDITNWNTKNIKSIDYLKS